MWISLERFADCNPQEAFLIHFPGWFAIQSEILSLETKDLLLTATAIRIHYQGSGFSVPTPPVQPALLLAGQGGGVWDQDLTTSSSITESSNSHAVESQDID